MSYFPDDRDFARSEDGSEPILGGSIGLNRILLMFKNAALVDKAPQWGLYLINAATVFRNVHATWKPSGPIIKDLSDGEAITLFQKDIDLYITYLTAYLASITAGRSFLNPYPLVVYYPNYGKIPAKLRVEPQGKTLKVWEQYERIRKKAIGHNPENTFMNQYLSLWEIPVGAFAYPHVDLVKWVQNYVLNPQTKTAYRWGKQKSLILSHCAIDLHAKLNGLELIESNTGIVKPSQQFWTKLKVPNTLNPIPFNAVTHQAFGDSSLIKGLLQRGAKKKALELSQTNKWMTKDLAHIVRDIGSVSDSIPSDFVKF